MAGAGRAGWNRWFKPVVLVLCAIPLVGLLWGAFNDSLGANPAETLIRSLGDWTLRLLWLTLAVTPLRRLFNWPELARCRRGLGLWAFSYACLHLLAYAWLDMGLDWGEVLHDVGKRPFILVGMLTLVLLLPLALTSFNRAVRWLGAQRWQRLHKAVYLAALLALLHFYWMRSGKRLYTEVHVYALLLAVLLGWRLWTWWRGRRVLTAS